MVAATVGLVECGVGYIITIYALGRARKKQMILVLLRENSLLKSEILAVLGTRYPKSSSWGLRDVSRVNVLDDVGCDSC